MSVAQQTLESRVQVLEDKEEILRLFMEYGRCLDAKDWEPYAELFAENGTFVSAAGVGKAQGRAEIRELFGKVLKDVPANAFHLFNNITIDVDGDRATARSFWTYVRPGEDGFPQILQFGHYDDVLMREHGRWKFELREITRDMGYLPYAKES
jgi:uncharacterized protein (TIGR02246 family)